jgi:hypothetical protein
MKKISAQEFDRRFDAGEDILPYLDLSTARFFYENKAKKTATPPAKGKAKVSRKPFSAGRKNGLKAG